MHCVICQVPSWWSVATCCAQRLSQSLDEFGRNICRDDFAVRGLLRLEITGATVQMSEASGFARVVLMLGHDWEMRCWVHFTSERVMLVTCGGVQCGSPFPGRCVWVGQFGMQSMVSQLISNLLSYTLHCSVSSAVRCV